MNKNFLTNLLSNLENPIKSNNDIIDDLKSIKNIFKNLNIEIVLEVACKSSRIEVIKYLFMRGKEEEKIFKNFETLIFNDIVLRNPELLQIFLNNINLSNKTIKNLRGKYGNTLLIKSAQDSKYEPKHINCLIKLVRYCDLDDVNIYNYTSIYYAYYEITCFHFFKILFKRGASIKGGFPNSLTPIKYFCRNARLQSKNKFLSLKMVIDLEPDIFKESRESNDKYGVDLTHKKRTAMDYLMEEYSNFCDSKYNYSKEGRFLIFLIAYLKVKGNNNKK